MVMAVNNAALLGGQAVVDTSGWADQFRDGQKLRQEYEGRQQQKALNEIMKVGDHNGRLELAQQHKYAGALVPQLQKYEEDRQKAALDNLKTSADIGKVYGETGKLGAETGEIGAKTMGQTIKNMTDKYSQISAGALTQNPQYFALMLGDFQNAGLINPEQKGAVIDMMMKDPENAAKVMQQLARGTIEGFKATAPEAKVLDGKDAAYMYTVNPYTGEASKPTQKVSYGQSPDNFADNEAKKYVSNNSLEGTKYSSDNSLTGTKYSSDNSYKSSVYGTDSRAATASEAQAVSWYNAENKANTDAVNAETKRIEANKKSTVGGVDANGKPVARKLEANERTKLFELQEQIDADIGVGESLKRLDSLSDLAYSGAGASFRGTAMSRIPGGGNNERANATVLSENITIELALKQLKSTFGAAPTEGERKILMDLQASVDKSPVQKKQIIAAAMRAVAERVRYRKKQQEAIRTGSYAMPKGNSSSSSSAKPKAQNNAGASIIGGILGGS